MTSLDKKNQQDINNFLKNKSPKEHWEILRWIACHYYPSDNKMVMHAISNIVNESHAL